MSSTINIKYSKNYVAFLDVLGFKNIVRAGNLESLNKYFTILEEVISSLNEIDMKSKIGYIVISDSIILTMPQSKDTSTNISRLRSLCIAIGIIQRELAMINIWLRGAISSGDTYFNSEKNQIIGPSYIDAYLLEENHAKYPRVIIDSKIIYELEFNNAQELINRMNKKDEGGLNYLNWKTNIIYDYSITKASDIIQDTPLFIDYLSSIPGNKNNYRTIICNLEKNIYMNNHTYTKYRWVTNYIKSLLKIFNETCINKHEYDYLKLKDITNLSNL